MGASFKADFGGLRKLKNLFQPAPIKEAFRTVVQDQKIAALIGQAVADNFDQQGPGWAPLKAATIRASVAKKLRKKIANLTNAEILKHEAAARRFGQDAEPLRMILQKTGLLKKTATIPNFSGSSKDNKKAKKGVQGYSGKSRVVSGSNIYKVQNFNIIWGTNLSYALVHQKGSPEHNIPARPFLKLSKQWEERLFQFVGLRVKSLLKLRLREVRGG